MNLHKFLAIALFSCFTQASLQAGLITFSNEEIEAKDPNSTVIDEQTGNVTMVFKHDRYTREKMLQHNASAHETGTFASLIGLMCSSPFACIFLAEIGFHKLETKITTGITALLAITAAYNVIKSWQLSKAKIVLPKDEHVVVGKVEKKIIYQ